MYSRKGQVTKHPCDMIKRRIELCRLLSKNSQLTCPMLSMLRKSNKYTQNYNTFQIKSPILVVNNRVRKIVIEHCFCKICIILPSISSTRIVHATQSKSHPQTVEILPVREYGEPFRHRTLSTPNIIKFYLILNHRNLVYKFYYKKLRASAVFVKGEGRR